MIFAETSVTEWAPVATAVAAAGAALASWRAVILTTRAILPDVQAQLLANVVTGCFDVVIRNSGGGIVKGLHFMLVADRDGAVGPVHDGFLGPGEGFHVETTAPTRGRRDARLVIFYRDANEVLRAWSHHGQRKAFRSRLLRRKQYPNNDRIFGAFYPNVTLHGVGEYAYTVERIIR
jgi:hypothetical protein